MKPELVAAIYHRALVLSLLSTLLPLCIQITPVYAAPTLPAYSAETTFSDVPPESEVNRFFTLDRDALNFSKFAQRSPRRDPYQIIETIRQRHQNRSQDISVRERVQRLKEQLPQQSEQLRKRVSQLPDNIKASASRANVSIRRSIEVTATEYLDERRLPPFLTKLKSDLYRIKRRLKTIAANFLEQSSDQLDQTAQHLKE